MKKLVLIACIAISATACSTAGKGTRTLASNEDAASDQSICYVRARAAMVLSVDATRNTSIVKQDLRLFSDGDSEDPEVKTKEECFQKAQSMAESLPIVYEATRRGLLGGTEDTYILVYFNWYYGKFKYFGLKFKGEQGMVTGATRQFTDGKYLTGDQRYSEDGTKWK